MIKKIRCKTDAEWLALRKRGIGGSDAGCILGMNPWKSAYALWAEKAEILEPEDISQKEAVRLGNELEGYVARRFEEITGKKVRKENATWVNDRYPFAHGNFDRLIVGERAGLECKTTSELNVRKFNGVEFPEIYYCQCVHYLMVSGLDRWYLAVLIGNREVKVFCLERDEGEIAALAAEEQRFWNLVQQGTPPEIDGSESTTRTLTWMYPFSEAQTVSLDGMEQDLALWFQLQGKKKEIEASLDGVANRIKEQMGNADTGLCADAKVSWKTGVRASFDSKAFLLDHPEFRAQYTKETETRVFRVTKKGA